jgi:hypothetical protein
MRFFGDDGKVPCPDHTTKYVETKPEKFPEIFGQYFHELSLKFKAGLNYSQQIASANAETSIGKSAHQIYQGYDAINAWAYSRFVSAYYVYRADPCKFDNFLKSEVQKINESLDHAALSELDKRLEFLKSAPRPDPASAGGDPRLGLATQIENTLDSVIEKLAV